MNAKRWIALGIVFALLIVSALAKFTSSQIASKEESSPTFVESLFADTGELTETVIEEGGNDTIAVLSVDGTIQDTEIQVPYLVRLATIILFLCNN